MRIALIAALARNGVIGHDNQLLWHLPEDMAWFRTQTRGHAVVMGRKTWDSLPPRFRPLPGRRNVVVTRQAGWSSPGAEVAHTLDEALALATAPVTAPAAAPSTTPEGASAPATPAPQRLFVIGGAELYALALPRADELWLTEIERDFQGDARFPDWPHDAFTEVRRERHQGAAPNDFAFSFVTYERR